METFEMS